MSFLYIKQIKLFLFCFHSLVFLFILSMELGQKYQKVFQYMPKGKQSFKNDSEKGLFIFHLLSLNYFKSISNDCGISQILLYIRLHMLQFYILRKDKSLIDQQSQYVFISGKINFCGINFGDVIDISKTGQYIAQQDCYFIQVKKLSKNWKIAKQMQLKKQTILKVYQRKIQNDEQKNKIFQELRKAEFFKQLSYFDLIQLTVNSSISKFQKNSKLNIFKQQIKKIGYIIQGEIKLQSSAEEQSKQDDFMKKFKINFNPVKLIGFSKTISKGQWIGLQQLFSETQVSYKWNCQVISKYVKVLQISLDQFNKKFNLTVCFQAINKLKNLVNSKKKIVEDSVQAQKMLKMDNKKKEKMKQSLIKKLKNYKNPDSQQKRNLSTEIRKQQNLQFVPETIIHKFKSLRNKSSLQTNQQRLNLFPSQYDSSFVYPNQRRQISIAKQNKERDYMKYCSPRDHKLACKGKQRLHEQISSQNILFSLTRKSTQNFIMQSSFYKAHQDNFQYSNINSKTIGLLQDEQAKKSIQRKKSRDKLYLPYLLVNKSSTLNFHLQSNTAQKINFQKIQNFNNSKTKIKANQTIQGSLNQLISSRSKILSKYRAGNSKSKQRINKKKQYLTIN